MSRARWYPWRALGLATLWGLPVLPVLAGLSRCPSALFLRRPCPGCGMTRAVKLALHGDLFASLRMHPVALPVACATLAIVAASVVETMRRGTPEALWQARAGRVLMGAFVASHAVAVVVWALRLAGLFGGPVSV